VNNLRREVSQVQRLVYPARKEPTRPDVRDQRAWSRLIWGVLQENQELRAEVNRLKASEA
jgi:hypothetical protein